MIIPKVQRNLLIRLAEHLETGKLGHDRFDFATISEGDRKENFCGTAGCALGELPVIWPDVFWLYSLPTGDYSVAYRNNTPGRNWDDVEDFFGLSKFEVDHLFLPRRQLSIYGGTRRLKTIISRQEIAAHLRAFCQLSDEQIEAARQLLLVPSDVTPYVL